MGDKYLRFECPNCPSKSRSAMECRRLMGGISLNSLIDYDFNVPFVDIRHCPTCSIFWKITIKGLMYPIQYEPYDGYIDFVNLDQLTCIKGRKIRKK